MILGSIRYMIDNFFDILQKNSQRSYRSAIFEDMNIIELIRKIYLFLI